MTAGAPLVDRKVLVEFVVPSESPDQSAVCYRVLRGGVEIASVRRRRKSASAYGPFRGGDLWETSVITNDGETWSIRPCFIGKLADASIFGQTRVFGLSLGKKRPSSADRVVQLLDRDGDVVAQIPTQAHSKTGILEIGGDSLVLTPCREATRRRGSKRGQLSDVLTISQEGKEMKDSAWLLAPTSRTAKPLTLPVALLYWHVLRGDWHSE